MMRLFPRIMISLSLLALLSGCSGRGRVIPREKFAKVYADMLLSDEWIRSHWEYRQTADTTLLYEPIFRKYGYSTKDYRASLDYYLNNPEKYAKILKRSSSIIEAKMKKLKALQKAEQDRAEKEAELLRRQARLDSLALADSIRNLSCIIPLYSSRFEFCDTLPYRDSLFKLDTIKFNRNQFIIDTLCYSVKNTDTLLTRKSLPGVLML